MSNKYIGSSLDDFLDEEGIKAEVQAEAIERVIAWHISSFLENTKTTKTKFAAMLQTNRAQVDRLLNPGKHKCTIKTMTKVAEVIGKRIELRLV